MATPSIETITALGAINGVADVERLIDDLRYRRTRDFPPDGFPHGGNCSREWQERRLAFLELNSETELPFLSGELNEKELPDMAGNIENFIGMTSVPTGVVGPLNIMGSCARGDFYVPLATSEGALVASYHRGAKATRACGGITSVCLVEAVQRSPVFRFRDLPDLGEFLIWVLGNLEMFKTITAQASRYAKLKDLRSNIEGNQLILAFEFSTGDAAGQNMVTLCTEQICTYILAHTPVQPVTWYIEGNYSGDKKATSVAFSHVRGKKVTAEAWISREVAAKVLNSTPEAIAQYWQCSTIGVVQSGALGAQGHFANGLTALFMATGQDVACVAEAANGITRMEVSGDELYVSVTLPNLISGTVGGGTWLPTQKECLRIMGCEGEGTAKKYAEIAGGLVLAGELSIAAAMASGQFSRAHKIFGRKRRTNG